MFRFNLQALLELRQQKEEVALLEFATLTRLLTKEQSNLDGIKADKKALLKQLNSIKDVKLHAQEISLLVEQCNFLAKQETCQEEVVGKLASEVEEKREELLKTMQERKLLEKLKSKERRRYEEDILKVETKLNDERITLQYNKDKT